MKKVKPKTFETEEKSALNDKFVSKAGHSKKCPSCRKLQKNSGITLATLVITIVVMLILAGVTVHTMIGDNGLIDSAKDLKENVETKDADMQDTINDLEIELNKGIPDIIAAIERGTNFINLSEVQLIDSENRQADAFEYYYKKASEGDSSYKKVDGATGAELQLTGLIHNTSYKIKIIAKKNKEALRTAVKNIKTKELLCADLNMQVEEDGSVYTSDTWTNKNIKVALVDATRSTYSTAEGSAQTIAQTNGESTVSEAGTTTIKVETTDGTNTVSKNYYVKIDRVAPTLIITSQGQPDQYPDVLTIKAQDNAVAIDHIELPDGTKIAGNGKNIFTTTYNATKNGPITCKVADALGNEGTGDFEVENVINFETEWTIPADNTKITVPVWNDCDMYIDFGDGTKENVKTGQRPSHVYEKAGTYIMKISGKCGEFDTKTNVVGNEYYTKYITGIKKWGCLENSKYCFYGSKLKGTIPEPHQKSFYKIKSFSNLFYWCNNLEQTIPANLFENCPNATNFNGIFSYCKGLTGNIPEKLFANCENATSFQQAFSTCTGLTGNIPEKLFENCPNVTSFASIFWECNGLTGNIPEKLFENCSAVTSFSYTFYLCKGLTGNIPEKLFTNCSAVTSFYDTFYNCTGLTGTISEKLFVNNTKVENFGEIFCACTGLTGNIPEKLFENCINVKSFAGTFAGCKNLTGCIPESLFKTCTKATNFSRCFGSCQGITGIISSSLFENCPDATSFAGTFGGCTELTGEIPENLFTNCTEVTNFSDSFNNCKKLTGTIPEKLFANSTEATDFRGTFKYCQGLNGNIPEDLFSACSKAKYFGETYYNERGTFAYCTNLSGNIPEKLFRNCPDVIDFGRTFLFCTNLTGNIPEKLFENCLNVTEFRQTFCYCTGLTGSIPDKLFINCTKVTDFSGTFSFCNALTGNIPENLFINCNKVQYFGDSAYNGTFMRMCKFNRKYS